MILKNIYCSLCRPGKNYYDVSEDETTQATERKRLCEANQQLLEKNIVNKPIDVGRNVATVNGELRRKKQKTMAYLDKHDHLTSTKIKKKNERQTENTRASSMSKLLDRKSCKEVEIPAKKRKLKDQDDTPPYANTVKEKRLNTSNADINREEKPLIKGNGMKIKLSVSRESSVDKSHEKDLNANSSRKDLESKHFQFGSTSSSSKAPNLDKVSPAAGRTISRKAHAKSSIRPEVTRKLLAREDNMQSRDIDASQSQKLGCIFELKRKEASKFTGTMSTQKSRKGSLLMSKDCGILKDLCVVSFLKEYASSQTAMTAFKKAKESKDYVDHLKYHNPYPFPDFYVLVLPVNLDASLRLNLNVPPSLMLLLAWGFLDIVLPAAGETMFRLGAFKRDDETDPTGDAFTSCKLALLKEPETFEELEVAPN
nr:cullin, conserved site-containing protein [Tanacetum cinerariifolium]